MKTLLLSIFTLLYLNCFSQDTVSRLSLNQCIQIALNNNPDIGRKAINSESARINWQQERVNLLPSLNAGITNGLNLGRSINPLTNAYVNDEVTYANPYVSSSLLLFNGLAQQHIIKQYSLIYQAVKQEERQTKTELALNVIMAYLEVLTNQDLLTLSKTRQQTTVKQLERLEVLNKNGAISPGEYYDLKGQYANDKLTVINAENLLENSKIVLVKLLNIQYKNTLLLEQLSTGQFALNYEMNADQVYQTAIESFASVKAVELRKRSSDLLLRSSKSMYLPSIYFNSGISSNYSNSARNSQGLPIGYIDQFNNNLSKSFRISVNIPLFNSYRTRNTVSLVRLQQKESELIAQSTRIQLQQLIEQAYFNMTASKERYLSLTEQLEAYKESFRTVEIRFNTGVVNSVDYLIAKNNLDRANADLLANRYDFILRKKILDFYQGKALTFE